MEEESRGVSAIEVYTIYTKTDTWWGGIVGR